MKTLFDIILIVNKFYLRKVIIFTLSQVLILHLRAPRRREVSYDCIDWKRCVKPHR